MVVSEWFLCLCFPIFLFIQLHCLKVSLFAIKLIIAYCCWTMGTRWAQVPKEFSDCCVHCWWVTQQVLQWGDAHSRRVASKVVSHVTFLASDRTVQVDVSIVGTVVLCWLSERKKNKQWTLTTIFVLQSIVAIVNELVSYNILNKM